MRWNLCIRSLSACPSSVVHHVQGPTETTDHLFLHCSVALMLWQKIFSFGGEAWVMLGCVRSFFDIQFRGMGRGKKARTLWNCAFMAVFWVVWLERNGRIFNDKKSSLVELWNKVHFLGKIIQGFCCHSSFY